MRGTTQVLWQGHMHNNMILVGNLHLQHLNAVILHANHNSISLSISQCSLTQTARIASEKKNVHQECMPVASADC